MRKGRGYGTGGGAICKGWGQTKGGATTQSLITKSVMGHATSKGVGLYEHKGAGSGQCVGGAWALRGGAGWGGAHLAEGELAVVGGVAGVADQHLPVVLDPARPAQHVVDARGHLVPLVVVPGPAGPPGARGWAPRAGGGTGLGVGGSPTRGAGGLTWVTEH